MITSIFFIVGFLLVLLVVIWTFNSTILRSNSPAVLKTIVQLIAPPDNLYEPLSEEFIDIKRGVSTKRISYDHRYMGSHEIGIYFDNPDESLFLKNPELKLSASIECRVGTDIYLSRIVESGSHFIGKRGSGYSLITYKVPQDMPSDKTINCTLALAGLNADFFNKYGPARIYVKKISDV
jgi:hypothetical protein